MQDRADIYIYISTLCSFLINNSFVCADNVNYSVTVEDSLSVSISSDNITFDLNPAISEFRKQDLAVTVGTNNPYGYSLYVGTDNDDAKLTKTDTNDEYIPTLISSVAETSFPANYWGYRIDSGSTGDSSIVSTTNYYPFIPNTLVSQSYSAINDNTSTLTFGAKANMDKPAGSYSLQLQFSVIPTITTYTMQELGSNAELAKSICTAKPTIVIDGRDGQQYTISKLSDGNCWMTQNLKLGKNTSTLKLSSTDSDVDTGTGFVLEGKSADGKFDIKTIDGTSSVNNDPQYYCANDYGCYYNWYTATAGSGTSYITSGNVDHTICPKGWTLPTLSQFQTLYNYYNTPSKILVSPVSATENIGGASMPGFLLAGGYVDTGGVHVGNYGFYWSRTAESGPHGYSIFIYPYSISPTNINGKAAGIPMRCLLR